MTFVRKTLVVLGTAAAFVALFELNNFLFSAFVFSKGVGWIFLPSGLRLAFILVFGEWGALGIVLASMGIGYEQHYHDDALNALVAGVISGASPLLARQFCADFLGLNTNLERLTAASLLKVAVVFATLSSLLHQIWYVAHGQTQDFFSSLAVMAFGDFTGTLIVLYLARLALQAMHKAPRAKASR